jgi:hypothetical protein
MEWIGKITIHSPHKVSALTQGENSMYFMTTTKTTPNFMKKSYNKNWNAISAFEL